MRRRGLAVVLCSIVPASASGAEPFTYEPPGALVPGSGQGAPVETVFAPGMRFPIESAPAFANSQVWGHGGAEGPGGGQCDVENYSYPWHDNYCETRSWDMPLCPAGTGHQGQDIRPATCDNGVHPMVAAAAGTVTNIGSYSVYVTAADGTRFDYLHGNDIAVSVGQTVEEGQVLGTVSNAFGGTPTTIHLHFNIRQDVDGVGNVYVSPYMSLVRAYEELLGLTGDAHGAVEGTDCTAIVGWAQSEHAPEASIDVRLSFDAPYGEPGSIAIEVPADRYREDLCETLGSCEHGFEIEVPMAMRDGKVHPVFVYALPPEEGVPAEVEASPLELSCPPPGLPDGVRRHVVDPASFGHWELSPLWHVAHVDDDALTELPEGPSFPEIRVVVRSDDTADDRLWWIDPGHRRAVSPEVAVAWGIDPDEIEIWPAHILEDLHEGTPLRPTPFLVQGSGPEIWVIDDAQCPLENGAPDPRCGGDESGGGDEGSDGSGGASTHGLPGPGAGQGDGGCGCTHAEPRNAAHPLVLLLVGRLHRRRRAPAPSREKRR